MQIVLDAMSFSFGIKVERVEIKDVRLPVQLQRAMAREAEETRSANAKVISANGEQKASVFYRNAAQTLGMSIRHCLILTLISGCFNVYSFQCCGFHFSFSRPIRSRQTFHHIALLANPRHDIGR